MPNGVADRSVLGSVKRVIQRLTRYTCVVGMFFVLLMMFLTTCDVIGRFFFKMPIPGTYELSEFILVPLVFLGLAYVQQIGGHVRVTLLVSRLSPRLQGALATFGALVSLTIAFLITWQGWLGWRYQFNIGTVTDILKIPVYPFWLLVFVVGLLLSLEVLIELATNAKRLSTR